MDTFFNKDNSPDHSDEHIPEMAENQVDDEVSEILDDAIADTRDDDTQDSFDPIDEAPLASPYDEDPETESFAEGEGESFRVDDTPEDPEVSENESPQPEVSDDTTDGTPHWTEDEYQDNFDNQAHYNGYVAGSEIDYDGNVFDDDTLPTYDPSVKDDLDYYTSTPEETPSGGLGKKTWAALAAVMALLIGGTGVLAYNAWDSSRQADEQVANNENFSIDSLLGSQNGDTSSTTSGGVGSTTGSGDMQSRITELEGEVAAAQSAVQEANTRNTQLQQENQQLKNSGASARTVTTTNTRTVTNTQTRTLPARTVTRTLPAATVTRTLPAPEARTVTRTQTTTAPAVTVTRTETATQRVPGARVTITTTVIQRVN